MADESPQTATLRAQLDRKTLVVGSEESFRTSFPQLAPDLLACENLQLCGELPSEDPAGALGKRIESLKPERIWIVGGDGTINLVSECAIRHQLSLPCWLTPAGTANDLARALSERVTEIKASTSDADSAEAKNNSENNSENSSENSSANSSENNSENSSENNSSASFDAADEPVIALDLLEVQLDDAESVKCCANMFTLGTSARNTQHVTSDIKARWGAFAYLTQFWRAIGDLEPVTIRLRVGEGDERVVKDILNVFIANGPYCGGGYGVAPPARVDDGSMDVVILRQGTAAELAHLAGVFFTSNHLEHNLVEHFSASDISIACDHSSPITLDGEALSASVMNVKTLPQRLQVTLIAPH